MTTSKQSYGMAELTKALVSLYPGQIPHDRHVFLAEDSPEEPEQGSTEALAQEIDNIFKNKQVTELCVYNKLLCRNNGS